MRFGILGPTMVWDGAGQEVAVGGARLRALLARLLLDPGQLVGTARLIDDLYGDEPPAGATNALQAQVSRLRRALGGLVESPPGGYRLAVAPDDVDAHRFTRLAGAGHRALATGDHAGAAQLLGEALALWRGPALADLAAAPFALVQANRLDELRLAATEDRTEAQLALGEPGPLVPELQQLVAAHPLRERTRGLLMRALAGSGRPAEALASYEQARQTLAEELGTDPSPELAAVHRAVLRGELPTAGPAPRQRVPAQLTSFVGRDEELRRVGKLLAEGRLVTLTGPGGAGKTRLAVEAAGGWAGEAYFVDLAPLVDGADVPQAVLSTLDLREAGLRLPAGPDPAGPDPTDRLVAALGSRSMLLLVDNCEHVVDHTAALVDRLLAACPQLRVLATSREPLGLTGEVLCALSGLAPEASVRLFTDRATDVTAAPVDPATVRTICQALDGLPLAIELAAARLRSLPAGEIAARLGFLGGGRRAGWAQDDRFGLLSRGSRTARPRHQTLRAVVEWSWELLAPAEQALARALSVFAGGATLAAVEQVAGIPDPVDVLAGLVEKSLVESAGGRYRMLETIRAYALERLVEAGEADATRRAHTAYFLELARTADPHLRRAEQLTWLSQLDAERDNLHAAVRQAAAAGDHTAGLQLVSALSMYWWLRGLRGEAAVLAREVLAATGDQPPPQWDEEYELCGLLAAMGGGGPAPVSIFSDVSLMERLDRPLRQPFLLILSGMAAGPPAGGADQLIAITNWAAARFDDPWVRATTPFGLGMLRMYTGELTGAEADLRTAEDRFRALGERWGLMMVLANLAELAHWRGEHAAAVTAMGEALDLAEQLGSAQDTADQLRVRAAARTRAGDLAGAAADYRRAIEQAGRAGAPEIVAAARAGLAELALDSGDLVGARQLCEQALALCPTGWFGAEATRSGILAMRGRVAEAAGDLLQARDWYRQALTSPVPELPTAIAGLAGLTRRLEGPERAAQLLGAGTVLLREVPFAATPDTGQLAGDIRAELAAAEYDRAFARGAALTADQARELLSAGGQ